MGTEAAGALAGVRVLDLTRARAGPTCTRQLSDMGADVVHVVDPRGRNMLGDSDFANLHRNKRSIALDLRHPDGVGALLRLADRADVFVENMRPGVKHRLGIGPEVMLERNPRLVYASLSGFGQSGPYADRPGLDQVAQGMGGLMSVTGPPGTGPWRVGIAISDTAAGTFLTQGVLAALFARERTGRGQWVHTSLLESMVNLMDFQACRWLTDGTVPVQEGNDHPTIFPMGAYRCADGYVNIAGAMALERFLDVIGARELLDDPRFADAESRRVNKVAFNEACEARLMTDTAASWVERLNAVSIASGPVYSLDAVFADPQVEHLAFDSVVEGNDGATVHVLRHPVTMEATPTSIRSGVARGGADTREVLAEAGFDDDAVDKLLASGAAVQVDAVEPGGQSNRT